MSDKHNNCKYGDDWLQRKLSTQAQEGLISEDPEPKRPDFWDMFPQDLTPRRPTYVLLRKRAYALLKAPDAGPIPDEHLDTWADLVTDLQDALLDLTPGDAFGFNTYLASGDLKAEQQRLIPALEKTHDFLKLYSEVLKHPPPEALLEIEQILRFRHNELQRIHSQPSPPGP